MSEQTNSFTEATNFLNLEEAKRKVVTPQTAESVLPEGTSVDFCFYGDNLFTQVQCITEELEGTEEVEQNQAEVQLSGKEELCDDFDFQILLQFLTNETVSESFVKKIQTVKDENDCCRLTFEKQYEKRKIFLDTPYKVLLFFKEKEGFTKIIWHSECIFRGQSKKKNVSLQDENFKLFLQIENFKDPLLKALGFRVPKTTIQEFYEYKYQLLNKSPLLNEITDLLQLSGLYYSLSQQNMGSRILQKLIQRASKEQLEMFCEEIKFEFPKMILDGYGNYVVQKIFAQCEENMKENYLRVLQKDFFSLLQTKTGTHTLQAITRGLQVQTLHKVYNFIEGRQVQLSKNQFGTHYIQLLIKMQSTSKQKLIDRLLSCFKDLSCNKYGIVVLKQILKGVNTNSQLKYRILQLCQNSFNQIANDQYGHYIIEELFLYYTECELQNLLAYISTYLSIISQNIYSSSIVRRVLQNCSETWVIHIVNSLLMGGGQKVKSLMETNPGNFIIHRVFDRVTGVYREYLLQTIWIHIQSLKSYEKRNKWITFFNQ